MSQSPVKLNASQRLVNKDGTPTDVFLQLLTKLSQGVVIVSNGTPEGVLEAPQYTLYVDESSPSSPVTYRKMLPEISGDRKKGWAVV